MESVFMDLRYAVRTLVKSPLFALVAVGVLAAGVGAGTAIFSVVNSVLLRPLPYNDPEQLVLVQESLPKLYMRQVGVSAAEYWDYRRENEVFSAIAAFVAGNMNLTGQGEAARVHAAKVSSDLFPLLGVPPRIGRTFSNEEDAAGDGSVAVISERLWRTKFGASSEITGQTIKLDEKPYSIIGVMPAKFQFPSTDETFSDPVDLWIPFAWTESEKNRRADSFDFGVIGRLKRGVTIEQAQANIEMIADRMQQQYPETYQGNVRIEAHVSGLAQKIVKPVRTLLLVLLGAVGLVLLVGCANVANLLLARSQSRVKEMAVRIALGASRRRLVRQLLTESLLLATVGGFLGLLLASLAVDLIVKFGPANLPRLREINIDTRVLIFGLTVSLITGIIFGLAPAIHGSRLNLNESLKESGGRSSGGPARNRMRSALVIFETASAVLLLIGAGLLIGSFMRLLHVPPGFDPDGVVVARVAVPAARYPKVESGQAMYRRVLDGIGSLPGVDAASVASNLPLADDWSIGFRIEGEAPTTYHSSVNTWVSNDYFRAMGISLVEGRGFTDEDREGATPVVIINQSFARKFWPGEDPLGKRIRWGGWKVDWLTVVGVVGDVRVSSLEAEPEPASYMPIFQVGRLRQDVVFVARTSKDPSSLVAAIREQIQRVDEELPVYDIKTMNNVIEASVGQRRFAMLLLAVFAGVALLLASVGLYAVMTNLVAQRRREIGIRMALGARGLDVIGMVVGRGALLAAIGVVSGLGGALALTRAMESLLFGVSATDPLVFSVVPMALMAVAVGACLAPALRAARVDPMEALRCE